ncbi:hypothetical protein GY45DRAFT_595224 [Cubamyces sp. BRFM 1775]|nr:hypothetical protein GY45DRAFT_595224 [Cubamyces sp. BRFM 1775]
MAISCWLEEQFLHLLPRLQHRSPASSDDGPFSWGEKVAWILGAHATLALYAAEAEHNSHDQPFSPSRIGPERWHGKELEPSQLYSMARIVDIGAFPARHQSVLISSKGIHVAFAFRTLQTSGYALDKPFEHLGAYLRAHAILLHAVAIHSCQLGISNSLQKGMKIALSDLSATFDNLSRSFRNDAPTDTKRHIFCPVVHIVHALSHELDFFQPLVPPDFWDNLDTLFSAFKQSGVSRYWLLVTVPCKKGYWEPSDLYDNAQALITKGRNSAGQTDKTHTIQQSGLRDNLPAEASTPSPPQCHGEEIPRPSDALITTVTTPPRTQTDPDASHRHSSDSYQTDPWMYYYGNDFPEI